MEEKTVTSPSHTQKKRRKGGKRLIERKRTWKQELLSWILTLGIPILIVLVLNQYVGKLVVVSGTSMYPTLYDHDILLVQTINYTPQQGDIVICTVNASSSLNSKHIVKRVIAVAGQTVTIDYDSNEVTVDGVVLDEPYLNTSYGDVMLSGYYENAVYVVPEGYIFVMGDNRNNSTDSRSAAVGMVSLDDVLGRSVLDIPVGHLIGDNSDP